MLINYNLLNVQLGQSYNDIRDRGLVSEEKRFIQYTQKIILLMLN